jgi:hypothetical protein
MYKVGVFLSRFFVSARTSASVRVVIVVVVAVVVVDV